MAHMHVLIDGTVAVAACDGWIGTEASQAGPPSGRRLELHATSVCEILKVTVVNLRRVLATYTINAVRKEPAYTPAAHQHIAAVRLSNNATLTRAQVIARIHAGDGFTTLGNPLGRVYVHPCPRCGFRRLHHYSPGRHDHQQPRQSPAVLAATADEALAS